MQSTLGTFARCFVVAVGYFYHVPNVTGKNESDAQNVRYAFADTTLDCDQCDCGKSAFGATGDEWQAKADRLLQEDPPSVVNKTVRAPSGDSHDYFSVSPCWWPDPAQPNGRPYVWRDGLPNPGNRAGRADPNAAARMTDAVETLSRAYMFTHRERYAKKAAQFVRIWFLDPRTRMTPHLQYAGTIPGVSGTRGTGIFEFRGLVRVIDSVQRFERSYAWTATDQQAFLDWLTAYHEWLVTSAAGQAAQALPNHHGSWYDVQVARLALALGHFTEAREILRAGLRLRLELQLQPDGSQPLEEAHPAGISNSLLNLAALFQLADLGERVEVDWWSYTGTDGRNLQTAMRHLWVQINSADGSATRSDREQSRGQSLVRHAAHHLGASLSPSAP
jgi:hypothetical protein